MEKKSNHYYARELRKLVQKCANIQEGNRIMFLNTSLYFLRDHGEGLDIPRYHIARNSALHRVMTSALLSADYCDDPIRANESAVSCQVALKLALDQLME